MNNRIVILYLFLYFFLLFTFYYICLLCHFPSMLFYFILFFFKIFAIYVLDIAEYINRQQQPDKSAWICLLRDAKADLGLRCPHMQKQSFSYDMDLVIKALKCQTWFSGKTNNRKLSNCRLLNLHREW